MPTTLPGHDGYDHDYDPADYDEEFERDEEAPRPERGWRGRLVDFLRSRAFQVLIPVVLALGGVAYFTLADAPSGPATDTAQLPTLAMPRPAPPSVDSATVDWRLPPPPPPTDGATATAIVPSTRDRLVIDALGAMVGMPTRPVTVTASEWTSERELSPFLHGIAADSKVVPAMDVVTRLLGIGVWTVLAGIVGAFLGGCVFAIQDSWGGGLGTFYECRPGSVRIVECLVMASCLFYLSTFPDGELFPFLAVASALSFMLEWKGRAKVLVTVLGLGAIHALLGIPMVPPHADLVSSYGPLGLHAWDIVATTSLAVACLSMWIPMPRQRITYVTVSAPSR